MEVGRDYIYIQKGDKHDVTNYRPISHPPAVGKVPEKIVYDQINLNISTIITQNQYEFMKTYVYNIQPGPFVNYLRSKMDESEQVDTMYKDFSKAFQRLSIA